MIIPPGATSISVDVLFLDDSGFPLTGKVALDFPVCKWSAGDNTADTTITLSDLALITTPHPNDNTAGGVKEREGGRYRLDLPNNMFASAGHKTLTFVETTNKRIISPDFDVQILDVNTKQINGSARAAAVLSAWLATGANCLSEESADASHFVLRNNADLPDAISPGSLVWYEGQIAVVTAYNPGTLTGTVTPAFTAATEGGNEIIIWPESNNAAAIAAINAKPSPLTASGTRAAIGMDAADLDSQLDAIASGGGSGGTQKSSSTKITIIQA